MVLKYQNEMDAFKLNIVCPDGVRQPDGLTAYRFSLAPIEHHLNFLPNILYDKHTPFPYNYDKANEQSKCSRCGASYYISAENAKDKWNTLTGEIRKNLGYTHLAEGTLAAGDGVMKPPNREGHFGFYESEEADLVSKFTITEELDVEN